MDPSVFHIINQAREQNRKLLAVLIDPDKMDEERLCHMVQRADQGGADLVLVGGSLLLKDALHHCLATVKKLTRLPVVLFPGSVLQISDQADALFFLSLISGRNPDLLIGNQVIAAPYLRQLDLEVIPTGYMLIESGRATTASYMSNSQPIPGHKPEIAACTAMAGEMLGLKLIYMDGGSGAQNPISTEMIAQVRQSVNLPLIIGGGIRTPEKALENCKAGADVVVVGNAAEDHPALIPEMADTIHRQTRSLWT